MIVYGKQVVFFVLNKYPHLIEKVYFSTSKKLDKKEFSLFSYLDKPIVLLDFKKAQAMSKGANHQGYFLQINDIEFLSLKNIIKSNFILMIDNIQDIGNVGAMLRSAYGFGVDGVIFSSTKDIKLSALIRASSGLALSLPLVKYFNTLDCINELKQAGFIIFGAHMSGDDIANIKFDNANKKVLVLSNEHSGLNNRVKQKIDKLIKIKIKKDLDSLNVSVAGAILMRELSL